MLPSDWGICSGLGRVPAGSAELCWPTEAGGQDSRSDLPGMTVASGEDAVAAQVRRRCQTLGSQWQVLPPLCRALRVSSS